MAILARINHQIEDYLSDLKKYFGKGENVKIAKYLDQRLILDLDVKTRDQALEKLVDLIDKSGKLKDKQVFYRAILEREKIVSTEIDGLGVAFPHAKLEGYSEFFIAIGIQKKEGIEWSSLDHPSVKLIFMIGGPDNHQTEYLKILSRLTIAIKNEERRKKLIKADPSEVIELFSGC